MKSTIEIAYYLLTKKVLTKKKMASKLDMSRPTLYSRLESRSKWKKHEIKKLNKIYGRFIKNINK